MSNSWLLRPSPEEINRMSEFLSENLIAIGWSGTNDLTGKTRKQIKGILSGPPYNYESLKLGNTYATIDIFVNQMEVGDLVLVPNGDDIHFCIIKSDYYFETNNYNNNTGYPHQRKVEWLSSTLRENLPIDLRNSLRVHRATADLSKYFDTINAFANDNPLPESQSQNSDDSFVTVDYPLRLDIMAKVTVPKNITKTESERLGDFIKTLYFQ